MRPLLLLLVAACTGPEPVAETDTDDEIVATDPCEGAAWCLDGAFTLTTVTSTVNGEPSTRALDPLEDVPVTLRIGLDAGETSTIDTPPTTTLTTQVLGASLAPTSSPLGDRISPSLGAGTAVFVLVDRGGATFELDGPDLLGAGEEEWFALQFDGGTSALTEGEHPSLAPFDQPLRVTLRRYVGEVATDYASGDGTVALTQP